MTLHPQHEFSIPEETTRVARSAYPQGNLYMKMRDALGTIYQDESFAHLFPQNGRAVEAPWRLALITIVQFMEELPDRQAAEAVRGRIDLKYALGLELTDPGFDFTILSDFRTRLVQGGRGAGAPGCHAGFVQRARLAQGSAAATHRLDPHPGQDPRHQSTDVRRRSHAICAQQPGRRGWRLAACLRRGRVAVSLWSSD